MWYNSGIKLRKAYMSSDNLVTAINDIAHNKTQIDDIFKLLDRHNEIMTHLDSYKDDLSDIMKNAQTLGFKAPAFKKLAKYLKNREILYGDAAEIQAAQALFDFKDK